MNWQTVIAEIQARGITFTRLARVLQTTKGTLGDIKSGRTKEPTGMLAVRLYKLYTSGVRNPREPKIKAGA